MGKSTSRYLIHDPPEADDVGIPGIAGFCRAEGGNELWEMVLHRNIEALTTKDWNLMKREFIKEGLLCIGGRLLTRIDAWRFTTFPNLDVYCGGNG
jgi:hypothetical protein